MKSEIQGSKGLIRELKDKLDITRKEEHEKIRKSFIAECNDDLTDYDESLNNYCNRMWDINDRFYGPIKFEYFSLFQKFFSVAPIQTLKFPKVYKAISFSGNSSYKERIQSIIGGIVFQSVSQSDKSLAGEAGENLTRTILESVGLKLNVTYRKQFNNSKGSATDFVYPYAEDGDISKVEIFIAAQFSSNDRARMASSELQKGGERYLVTGNGMDASSKVLKDIGNEIIQDYKSENIKIVAREKGKLVELDRINKKLSSSIKHKEKISLEDRKAYIEDYIISMKSFAEKLKSRAK